MTELSLGPGRAGAGRRSGVLEAKRGKCPEQTVIGWAECCWEAREGQGSRPGSSKVKVVVQSKTDFQTISEV